MVVFASDGLPEAPAWPDRASARRPEALVAPNTVFGFERLAAVASSWALRAPDAEQIATGLWSELMAWSGESAHPDDMTLLVLRVAEPAHMSSP